MDERDSDEELPSEELAEAESEMEEGREPTSIDRDQCCRGQPWPSGSRQKLPIFMLTVSDREPPTCLAV